MAIKRIALQILLFIPIFFIANCASKSTEQSNNFAELPIYTENGDLQKLDKLVGPRGLILISHRAECPIVKKYSITVESLNEEFSAKGIPVIYFNSEDWEERSALSGYIQKYGIKTKIFNDQNHSIAKALGVKRTAEVIFLSADLKKIIYQGAIDDRFDYEESRPPRNLFLKEAVTAHLQGKDVKIRKTVPLGCLLNLD
jgi:thioredoxin-related protein